MKLTEFKSYREFETTVDDSKGKWLGFLLVVFGAFTGIFGIMLLFEFELSEASIFRGGILVILSVVSFGLARYYALKAECMVIESYFDYLESSGLDEVTLYSLTRSPEFDGLTKKFVIDFLNERRTNWSLRHPQLWACEI